jgi:hypothetical protein
MQSQPTESASSPNRAPRPLSRLVRALATLVPTLLVGAGVFAVAAGLFNYLGTASALQTATSTPGASASAGASSVASLAPSASLAASGSVTLTGAVATRITVPALGIDLPVVHSPAREEFPLCNAAEYMSIGADYAYPGLPRVTYLYAHARTGMFGPLLTQSQVNDGQAMVGMWVEVYTDDNQRHVYEIAEVLRHVPADSSALTRPFNAGVDQLWLQTSEDKYSWSTKLQVVANPVGVVASTQADAHPAGKGSVCPDAPVCTTAGDGGCRAQ